MFPQDILTCSAGRRLVQQGIGVFRFVNANAANVDHNRTQALRLLTQHIAHSPHGRHCGICPEEKTGYLESLVVYNPAGGRASLVVAGV